MLTEFERAAAAAAAHSWMQRQGIDSRFLPRWDVGGLGWPDPALGLPVYVAVIPEYVRVVPMGAEAWSRVLRRAHDPEEEQAWAFVPAGDGKDEVWLVLTKRVAAERN